MNTRTTLLTAALGSIALSSLLAANPWDNVDTSARPAAPTQGKAAAGPRLSYIVEAGSLHAAREAVLAAGGSITHELGVIDAVGASLDAGQLAALLDSAPGIRVYDNAAAEVAGRGGSGSGSSGSGSGTTYPSHSALVGADRLHAQGITGAGVTVAVIDSGTMSHVALNKDTRGLWRYLSEYDATTGTLLAEIDMSRLGQKNCGTGIVDDDGSGHGTHVSSIILDSASGPTGGFNGIAPDARLVSVKAFDASGRGSYADVIRGIDWVIQNRTRLGIRVLNMSLSATPRSYYWDDPLNRAVMRAWQAGILVVASAGNTGPAAMTIGVPGNVPYVVTVGAMSDNFTPGKTSDDVLASFSSVGPTVEGFVKPEVVAPGGHVLALMQNSDTIAVQHPEFHDGGAYFTMSGTSQSAAVTSGVAALLLQAEPWLTPNQLKCKLMSAARPAVKGDGSLAYSVFQQGAGVINAYDAVYGTVYDCANRGMDVNLDLAGIHFGGRANRDANGNYYLMGLEGYLWNNGYLWSNGYLWTNGYLWNNGYVWSDGYLWNAGYGFIDSEGNWSLNNTGYLWNNGYLWSNGYLWTNSLSETASINVWVNQE
jgi:subtilisin family serine protease